MCGGAGSWQVVICGVPTDGAREAVDLGVGWHVGNEIFGIEIFDLLESCFGGEDTF